MPRPAKKRAYWENKKAEAGRLQAQKEFKRKQTILESLKELVPEIIKKIDPLELAAVLGFTAVVKTTIETSEPLQAKAIATAASLAVSSQGDVKAMIWQLLNMHPYKIFTGEFPFHVPNETPEQTQQLTETTRNVEKAALQALDSPTMEVAQWLVAFSISYILVKHAGQIIGGIGSITTSLPKLIGMFLV